MIYRVQVVHNLFLFRTLIQKEMFMSVIEIILTAFRSLQLIYENLCRALINSKKKEKFLSYK